MKFWMFLTSFVDSSRVQALGILGLCTFSEGCGAWAVEVSGSLEWDFHIFFWRYGRNLPALRFLRNSYRFIYMPRPFKSELVLEERIHEAAFRAYHVGFDENKFRLQPLVDIIRNVIPEFALGYHAGMQIPLTDLVERLKEAAETVYLTDHYKNRGEFGELILHLLLRDFCESIPLVSKIYFKDSHNVPAHGFDGVHVTTSDKKLWLGESKLYKSGKAGAQELAEDLKKHVTADYLKREFSLLSRKLPEAFPDVEYWRELMDKHKRLSEVYAGIVIPMVCTYSSSVFDGHTDNTDDYYKDFEADCRVVLKEFEDKKIETSCDVILLTLPVPCKNELNAELDKRLKHMQQI